MVDGDGGGREGGGGGGYDWTGLQGLSQEEHIVQETTSSLDVTVEVSDSSRITTSVDKPYNWFASILSETGLRNLIFSVEIYREREKKKKHD